MENRAIRLTSNKLISILKNSYSIIPKDCDTLNIVEYPQGYMNHVFEVKFSSKEDPLASTKKSVVVIYNSMRYKGDEWKQFLTAISAIGEYLTQEGYVCRNAVKNLDGDYISTISLDKSGLHFLGVYDYIEGKTIEWNGYTRRHLRAIGEAMAKMHVLLELRNIQKEYAAIKQWQDYFAQDNQRLLSYLKLNAPHVLRKVGLKIDFDRLNDLIAELKNLSESQTTLAQNQLIHCDFVRGNILFTGKKLVNTYEIAGILDFEKMLYGPVEVDLARTYAFLLVDCQYKTADEVNKYFLEEGYGLLGRGRNYSISYLNRYMVYFWLRDFWKFLECNPYESLVQNYHFNKTVEILLRKKFLIAD